MGISNLIKKSDLFCVPVQLTYRGEREFKTITGGCCSILFLLAVVTIFAVYSATFFNEP